jgi:hypothetical protein
MTGRGYDRNEPSGLTRISVRSTSDHFLVRLGDSPAVRVRKLGRELECECGRSTCQHISSLRLCGFVDAVGEMPLAA